MHIIPADGLGGVEAAARSMAARHDLPCYFRLLPIAWEVGLSDRSQVIVPVARSFTPRAYAGALENILSEDPDVVICSLWRSVPLALTVKLLRPRTKLALFVHSAFTTNVVDLRLNQLAMSAADEIWADSQATLDARVPAKWQAKSRIISFVTERLARARPVERAPRASFVSWGRLHHYKGIDNAIRLVKSLVARGVDATFDIWGPDNDALEDLIALRDSLGLGARIVFRGPAAHERIADIAAAHDFYLQLSRFEGMAMSVVEAMQLGLVPVVTPVGQMPRYCRSGENAVVVDIKAMNSACVEIEGLLASPDRYRLFQSRGEHLWAEAPLYADDVSHAALALAANDARDVMRRP